jgi:hypothetical protein
MREKRVLLVVSYTRQDLMEKEFYLTIRERKKKKVKKREREQKKKYTIDRHQVREYHKTHKTTFPSIISFTARHAYLHH